MPGNDDSNPDEAMAKSDELHELGGRSREVMDVIYRHGEATAGEIHDEIPDFPSYSAVRSILGVLERKGLIRHRQDGPRYVYSATVPRREASLERLRRVVDTFFGGSPGNALKAILELDRDGDGALDYEEIERLVRQAREREE
jgi:predicted transcriptional regulator